MYPALLVQLAQHARGVGLAGPGQRLDHVDTVARSARPRAPPPPGQRVSVRSLLSDRRARSRRRRAARRPRRPDSIAVSISAASRLDELRARQRPAGPSRGRRRGRRTDRPARARWRRVTPARPPPRTRAAPPPRQTCCARSVNPTGPASTLGQLAAPPPCSPACSSSPSSASASALAAARPPRSTISSTCSLVEPVLGRASGHLLTPGVRLDPVLLAVAGRDRAPPLAAPTSSTDGPAPPPAPRPPPRPALDAAKNTSTHPRAALRSSAAPLWTGPHFEAEPVADRGPQMRLVQVAGRPRRPIQRRMVRAPCSRPSSPRARFAATTWVCSCESSVRSQTNVFTVVPRRAGPTRPVGSRRRNATERSLPAR